MNLSSKAELRALVVSLTLGAAVTFGPVTAAGSGAKAQELEWATSAGGAGIVQDLGIATDPRGNGYVTGRFFGTATFGAGEANETVLTSTGSTDDVFVATYAPNGTLLWATSAGGGLSAQGRGIAADPRGNGYVTGRFFGTATFGAGEANETVLTSAGSEDMFVAKYAPNGTLLWATSAGGGGIDRGLGIATDPLGNGYVTGFFLGPATFGAGEANETVLTSAGSDVFVAKYAPNGTLLWATSAGGAGTDWGRGIATDPRGNGYVTGQFSGMATFGAGEANETVLTSAGSEDMFVAKYAPNGTLLWATSAGGARIDLGLGIATDPRGNGYVTGRFSGTATFGVGEANETVLTSTGSEDVFVAKYRP
jgi:hypothetical protein